MKIAKSKLAQIVQEELSNTMSEMETWKMGRSMKADDLAADPLYAAENKGIVDAQDDFARIQAGGKVLQIDTTEETEEEEIAYAQAYHKTMDRLKQNVADRKLYRPPPPETDADREASDAELDFEATYSEGMMDAIKNKLSPKRPTATAPRKRSENGNEKMYQMGVEDAEDAMHISGDYRESPSSDDEDYMAGWNDTIQGANSALQEGTDKMKITKSKLAQIIQEEVAAATLQEAPLPADEYDDTVEYLWSQNLSDIVLPFKHATSLDGEFPPAIETIVDYWEKKDFKGMASEWLDLRDELDDWLESRGFNWSIRTEEDPGSRYVDYSIPNGKKGRMPRNVIDTNFKHAFRLIRMLIDNTPAEGYDYRGFAGMSKPGVTSARYRQDTLGRRQTQEGKNKMKITKSALAQIVQEEVAAIKSEGYGAYKRDELGDENERIYPQRELSRHAKELAGRVKKGKSIKNKNTHLDDEQDRAEKLGLSGGLDEAGKGTDALESHMLGREHALAVSKGEMAMEDTWERQLSNKDYERGFDEQTKELDPQANWDDERVSDPEGGDDDWMWENKITKSKLAQIIQEELKATLSEDGSGYSWGMRPPPKAEPSVDEAAADSGVQQMIYDYIEDNLENGPLSLDNILTLTQPTADDAYAPLEDIWEEVLEAAIEELELAEEIVRVQDWNDPSSLPRWTI